MTDHRLPAPPPDPLWEWMVRFGGADQGFEAAELQDAGLRALREALARPGRDREGAYALLAADALITYAAGRRVEEDRPEAGLGDLLKRVAGEVPG